MLLTMMKAKLHRATVTRADLDYEGSIALDPDHCDAAGILPLEFVEIWNKTTGTRISTYVIHGERGSACCILNGAAARTCQIGDELIIAARADVAIERLCDFVSRTVIFGAGNRIACTNTHQVGRDAAGNYVPVSADADSSSA
jgi:aspartate 1-decarboxylase